MEIGKEIRQEKFKDDKQKAVINILFTSSWLNWHQTKLLKPYDISIQQFNILRILKGQQQKPVTLKFLSERMIDKMSNASRLVDKLYKKGMIDRQPCEQDRRQVDVSITDKGLQIIDQASKAVENHREIYDNLNDQEAQQLNMLLDKMRG